MRRKAGVAAVALTVLAVAALAFACSGNGDDGDRGAVGDTVRSTSDTWNAGDLDGFLALFTDRGLAQLFGVPEEEVEAIKTQLGLFIGDSEFTINDVSVVEMSDATAAAHARLQEANVETIDRFDLVLEEEAWKVDGYERDVEAITIPRGYATVDIEMEEFDFVFDSEQISAGSLALAVENTGEQEHELIFAGVPNDFDLEEALVSPEAPEGLEFQGRLVLDPGESGNMVFVDELPAGRYIMVCFLPDESDPAGTAHAFLGMTAEFDIE